MFRILREIFPDIHVTTGTSVEESVDMTVLVCYSK